MASASKATGAARKRLILHIGMPKTGTSTIQHTLASNESCLRGLGILYPRFGRAFDAHHPWVPALVEAPSKFLPDPASTEEIYRELSDALADPEIRAVVVSSEGFFSSQGLRPALIDLARRFDPHVVAVLRHPQSYLDSLLNQVEKMRIYEAWGNLKGQMAWKTHVPRRYLDSLAVWEDPALGATMHVRVMDGGVDVWSTFAEIVDPRLGALTPLALANISLPPEALAFIRCFAWSARGMTHEQRSMISSILDDYAANTVSAGGVRGTLLPPEATDYLTSQFAGDLRELERRHFNGERVFLIPRPKDHVDLEGLSDSDIAPVKDYVIERLAKYAEALARAADD